MLQKEKIIEKLKLKDYNKELEGILLNKNFSKETKNLLLSMLYKIENSYEDYKKIKVIVPTKKEFLEELISIIEKDCKEIDITKPNIEIEDDILNGKKSISIKKEQKIITYQNELALLQAIYKLNSNNFNIDIKNNKMASNISTLLNIGEGIAKSEIIRDFDGWSWNCMTVEIEDHVANLVYQCMNYALGYEQLNKCKNMNINDIETLLKEKYKNALAEKIIKTLIQLSILYAIKQDPDKCKIYEDIREILQETFEEMNDKKKYIETITEQKKKAIKEIEKIDKYLNDDILLKKEYIKQNEKLPQNKRVFSLSEFSENIHNKREKLTNEIEELTQKLKPRNYVRLKAKIEKDLNVIQELNFETPDIESYEIEFVNLILRALSFQIEKIENKREIIDKVYMLRYLKFLNISETKTIGEVCSKQIEKTEKNLITKGCNLKTLVIFSESVDENYKIYKNIFDTKIIDLESAYIEIDNNNKMLIYDENSLEKKVEIPEFKEIIVKYNKKIKIFM